MDNTEKKNQKEYALDEMAIQKILLIILCLMSFQPLVGLTANISMESREALLADVNNLFLYKALIIRFLGYIAGIVSILAVLLAEKVSIKEFFAKIYYKKPWNILFSLLLLWILFNVNFVSPNYEISMNGEAYRFEGVYSIMAYAGFFAAASLMTNFKYKKIWMVVSVGCSTLLAICSLYSLWAENPIVLSYMNRQINGTGPLSASFVQFNHYGYYLCVMLLISAGLFISEEKKSRKIIYLILFAFHQYVLALNCTRGSVLAGFIALVLLTILGNIKRIGSKKQYIVLWIAVVLSVIPASGTFLNRFGIMANDIEKLASQAEGMDNGGSGRIFLWKCCIDLIKMNPIFGYGLNMALYAMEQIELYKDMPHNEYLQHAVDLGIPGLTLYLSALGSLFVATMKRIKEIPAMVMVSGSAAVAYAISAFFGVSIVEVLPFFYILLGFVKWDGMTVPTKQKAEQKFESETTENTCNECMNEEGEA